MRAGRIWAAAGVAALALACESDGTGPGGDPPDPSSALPAAVRASADSLTLRWLGETSALTASILDARGVALAGERATWRSADSTVASVDTAGTVRAQKPGATQLFAELGRLADTVAIRVVQIPARVETAPATLVLTALGDTATVRADVKDQGGSLIPGAAVAWASADTVVAAVDARGTIRALRTGATSVRATSGAATAELAVQVRQDVATLELAPTSLDFTFLGQERVLQAAAKDRRGNAAPAATLTWRSSDASVASVDSAGRVAARASGRATITVGSGAAQATASANVTQIPNRVDVAPKDAVLTYMGHSVRLTARLLDEGGSAIPGATAQWSSTSGNAPVDANGVVTMWGRGTVTITATIGQLSGQAPVVMQQVASRLAVSPSQLRFMRPGLTLPASARLEDAGGYPVAEQPARTWTSRDERIARVGADGMVTSTGVGDSWIVAAAGGFRDSLRVSVTNETYWLDQDSVRQTWTTRATYGATWVDGSGNPVRVAPPLVSRNPAIVEVTGPGSAYAVGGGATWLVSTYQGATDSMKVTVENGPTALTIRPPGRTLTLDDGFDAVAEASNASWRIPVKATWTTRNPAVVSLTPRTDGTAQARSSGAGTTWIVAQANGLTDSLRVDVSCRWGGDLLITTQAEYERARDLRICEVGRNFVVENTPLTTLAGLETVAVVRGEAIVRNNPSLADLDGLGFDTLGASLQIVDNPAARSMRNLGGLAYLNANLKIIGNGALLVPVFPSLARIDELHLLRNAGVADPAPFPRVTLLRGPIYLGDAAPSLVFPALTTAAGAINVLAPGPTELRFPELTSGVSFIFEQARTTTLTAPRLTQAGLLLDRTQLTRVDLPALASGGLRITGNTQLRAIRLPALANATELTLTDNAALDTVSVLALRSLSGAVIRNNATRRLELGELDVRSLTLTVMPELSDVTLGTTSGGNIDVTRAPKLASLVFPRLATAGTVSIVSAPLLTTLGAPVLRELISLTLSSNGALATPAMPMLNRISNRLTLQGLAAMTRLDWLSTVTAPLALGLTVQSNAALTDVQGLRNIGRGAAGDPVISQVVFTNNTALPESRIRALLDVIEAYHPGSAFVSVTISGNAAGAPPPQ